MICFGTLAVAENFREDNLVPQICYCWLTENADTSWACFRIFRLDYQSVIIHCINNLPLDFT